MFAESGAAVYTLGCGALYLENIAGWLECREVEYLIDLCGRFIGAKDGFANP